MSLRTSESTSDTQRAQVQAGVCVSGVFEDAVIELEQDGKVERWQVGLMPGEPFLSGYEEAGTNVKLRMLHSRGREIFACEAGHDAIDEQPPPGAATEPPLPEEIASGDELYVVGLHLEQYRHATQHPELHWREALRRDGGDARSNSALGRWHLRREKFTAASDHFRGAPEL